MSFSPAVVAGGQVATLTGTGFPANTVLTMSFDGAPPFTVTSDGAGNVRLPVVVLPRERAGTRRLKVVDQPGRFTGPSAQLLVMLSTFKPQGNDVATFRNSQRLVTRG
jgi:hypothetical protein